MENALTNGHYNSNEDEDEDKGIVGLDADGEGSGLAVVVKKVKPRPVKNITDVSASSSKGKGKAGLKKGNAAAQEAASGRKGQKSRSGKGKKAAQNEAQVIYIDSSPEPEHTPLPAKEDMGYQQQVKEGVGEFLVFESDFVSPF